MHPYDEPHPLHDLDDPESLERAFWDDEPTRVLSRIGRLGASDVRRPVVAPRAARATAPRQPGSRPRRHAESGHRWATGHVAATGGPPTWSLDVDLDGALDARTDGSDESLDGSTVADRATAAPTAPARRPGRAAVVVGPTTALTARSRRHVRGGSAGAMLGRSNPGRSNPGRSNPGRSNPGQPVDPFVRRLGALFAIAAVVLVVVWSARDGGEVLRAADAATAAASVGETSTADGVAPPADPVVAVSADPTPPASTSPVTEVTATVPPTVPAAIRTASVPTAEVESAGPVAADSTAAPATAAPAAAAPASTAPAATAPPATAPPATAPPATAPATSTPAATPTASTAVARITTSPPCANRYTVVAGDTWIGIATKVGTSTAALLAANDAGPSTLIYPGGRVCLPAGATAPATTAPAQATTVPAPTAATSPPATQPATTAPATTQPAVRAFSAAENEAIIRAIWPDDLEEEALRIARRESNLQNRARNWCCSGLFQIYYEVHRSWLAGIGVTSAGQLLDPTVNTQAAYALYQRAGGFGPWEP